ncbi:DUF6776 family protein [Idiomarina xiamenensis]|uniref:Uncharacterized protein n=1 Tax=Idiomarina xiamenensis 10-D-4 TaxID=740709 RepID=K2JVM2_9GAMM|nr:DUF6776 family protein [Idiomarina xiamenensis]EKE87466.1 hypothetical protein A10D4_00180 [Idiomarina xiamenensis 10-D-4]
MKKAYFSLTYWRQRLGRLPVTLILVAIAIGLLLLGHYSGHWRLAYLQQSHEQQQQRLDELYQQVERMEYQQHVHRVELDVERASNQSLQQELAIAQDENFALRRELAFYQKIMAPELEAEGVMIDSLLLRPNVAPGHYHFRLALIQLERRRELVKGEVAMTLRGRVNGESRRLDLISISQLADVDRQFAMRYFSLLEGDFILPTDFVPERIDVQVTLASGSNRLLERSFSWSRLLQPLTEEERELAESLEVSLDAEP